VRLVTAPLGSRQVRLDGEPLALGPGGELPALPSTQAPYAVVALPPTSYASVTQPNAGARACGVRR
jgi:hypothetical protein